MALLGLFHRKDKQKYSRSNSSSRATPSETDSAYGADTSEYVSIPSSSTPTGHNGFYNSPLAAAASSSKVKLAFGRKKSTPFAGTEHLPPLPTPRNFAYSPSAQSEADVDRIRPPPSKAALFSAYGDPVSALSTRSLPSNRPSHSRSSSRDVASVDTHSNNIKPPPIKKSGGLFAWAHRDRKKSKPPPPPPSELNLDFGKESFSLKSFRHIGAESPSSSEHLPPRPPSSLSSNPYGNSNLFATPPVRPRLRENSVASDSSQRISVAAFREAARRNASPSPRPPSTTDLSRIDHSPSLLHTGLLAGAGTRPPLRTSPVLRTSTANALSVVSSSSEDTDSGESESDDSAGSSTLRPKRNGTITQRTAGKASTELGHRMRVPSSGTSRVARTTLGHGEDESVSSSSAQKDTRISNVFSRPRASASTSALHPNAAAKRASILASTKVPSSSAVAPSRRTTTFSSSSSSSSSDSESEDDAPLASLVMPKRPASSASNATSGSRSRVPSKPLIDITSLRTPSLPPIPPLEKAASPPLPDKESEKDKPTWLTHSDKLSISDRLAKLTQGAGSESIENLSGVPPIGRRSVDLSSPPRNSVSVERGRTPLPPPSRSQTAPIDFISAFPSTNITNKPITSSPTSIPSTPSTPGSPTRTKPNGRSLSSPNAAVFDLTDTKPIVPTPIRERSPPPAFHVTSRPTSQLSVSSSPRLSGGVPASPIQSQQQAQPSPLQQPTIRMIGSSTSVASEASSSSGGGVSAVGTPNNIRNTLLQEPISRDPPPRSSSRQRSSTLIPDTATPSARGFTGGGLLASPAASSANGNGSSNVSNGARLRAMRQRSSTMVPKIDTSSSGKGLGYSEASPSQSSSARSPPSESSSRFGQATSSSHVGRDAQSRNHPLPSALKNSSTAAATSSPSPPTSSLSSPRPRPRPQPTSPRNIPSPSMSGPPPKPFAEKFGMRGNSPASSTGDSSSGRTPLTPADGSEIGLGSIVSGSAMTGRSGRTGASGGNNKKHANVTFEDEKGRKSSGDEERRKERRRVEAKAAIELGNVVNGRGPIDDEDEDEDVPLNSMGPRMSMGNPMVSFTPPTPMSWRPPSTMMGGPMTPNPYMYPAPPPNPDPNFIAAHQQAMMVAKQAYQYAVAQQAMAAANEEWERGSNATSAFGGFGMGGMGGMPAMGMPMSPGGMFPGSPYGMGMQPGWPGMFPSTAQSMYAPSMYGGSELGINPSAVWGSRSEYGGGGGAGNRSSAMFRANGGRTESHAGPTSSSASALGVRTGGGNGGGVRPRTKTAPSDAPLPPQHARARQAPPPSSWKTSPHRGL